MDKVNQLFYWNINMMLTDYFSNIPFIYDNIILPISTNPFSNIYAVIYCGSIVILYLFIIYF